MDRYTADRDGPEAIWSSHRPHSLLRQIISHEVAKYVYTLNVWLEVRRGKIMGSREDNDYAANLILRESYQLVADHVNVDCIAPLFYQKHCLSLEQLQYLQNRQGNLTDQDKKKYLLNNVLMNGG